MCLAQGPQRSDAGEAGTRGPSVSSELSTLPLSHCTSRFIMLHFIRVYTVWDSQKDLQRKEYNIFLILLPDTLRSVQPGQSQVCCIKPEGFTSIKVNSYGHVRTVSSPYHNFPGQTWLKAVNQYFMHILPLVTDNNPSWILSKGGESERRNYFMINLHESMGQGRDRTLQSDTYLHPDTLPTACCVVVLEQDTFILA